jgi:hypothetical protein
VTKKESDFAHDVLKPRLEAEFPGCVIIKQDPNTSFQGVPDHLVLFEDKWAALETKRAKNAARQPNQPYYIEKMDGMSYASFVDPSNIEGVISDLQAAFRSDGEARAS